MGEDPQEELQAVFAACCNSAAVAATDAKSKGRGWQVVRRDGKDPVSVAWQSFCDNLGDGFVSSRRAKEADWASLLGVAHAVECDISPNGSSTLAIRFRVGDPRLAAAKFNEEIIPSDRPPEPP